MASIPINEVCKICGKLIKDDIPEGRHFKTHYKDDSGRKHKHCVEKMNSSHRKPKN